MLHYDRLNAAINARRLTLGLTWKQFAEMVGLSDVSLRNFRKGRSDPNPLSTRLIEVAMDWEGGSVDAVLNGGKPTPRVSPDSHPGEARRLLVEALQLDDPGEMRAAIQAALAHLTEQG